jgi:hypothetical protein
MASGGGSGIVRHASRTRAPSCFASASTSAKKSASASPVRTRYALTRSMGSLSFHTSSSLASRYLVGSSVVVCAPIR